MVTADETTRPPAPDADACHDRLRADGLDAPAFQRAVLAVLVAVPGILARAKAPFVITVAVDGILSTARLDEAFKRYRHGENEPAWVAAEVALATGVPADLVEAATGVRVQAEGPFPRLARPVDVPPGTAWMPCPFDPALAVFFVRELPSGHITLSPAEVASGWADMTALLDDACARLADRTPPASHLDRGAGAERVLGFATGDGFDAARALLTARLAELASGVLGRARFAIPTRDVLMLIGDADPAFVAGAEAHVAELYATHPFPVSAKWYTI